MSEPVTTNGRTRLLTAEELADRWSVPVGQVYRLSRADSLPTVRLGRYVRFAEGAIEAFERDGGTRNQEGCDAR
jgi:excisionase family DNA binding protein